MELHIMSCCLLSVRVKTYAAGNVGMVDEWDQLIVWASFEVTIAFA